MKRAASPLPRSCGGRVTASSSRATSLPHCKQLESPTPIDLLLAELIMPKGGVNGLAMARMARMRRPTIKVLHCTGYDVGEQTDARVVRKPVSDERLLLEVGQVLAVSDTAIKD